MDASPKSDLIAYHPGEMGPEPIRQPFIAMGAVEPSGLVRRQNSHDATYPGDREIGKFGFRLDQLRFSSWHGPASNPIE